MKKGSNPIYFEELRIILNKHSLNYFQIILDFVELGGIDKQSR
jgi:hypothetical protein